MAAELGKSELVAQLCEQVTLLMMERQVASCVLGSRLLLGLLVDAQIEALAIGVGLTVSDPIDQAVFAGDTETFRADNPAAAHTKEAEVPGGFPGHVVVLARADGRPHLLDPTAFQVIRFWAGQALSPPLRSVTIRLSERPVLELNGDEGAVVAGWTYLYSPEPSLDWSRRHEWVGKDRNRLQQELRRRVTLNASIDLVCPPPPGRNEPCSCGSGDKYKRCCALLQDERPT